jgi:hypothetical protein
LEKERTLGKVNHQLALIMLLVLRTLPQVKFGTLQSVFMENQVRKNFNQIMTLENLLNQDAETLLGNLKMKTESLVLQLSELISPIKRKDQLQIIMYLNILII